MRTQRSWLYQFLKSKSALAAAANAALLAYPMLCKAIGPTFYTWNGLGTDNLWSDGANWVGNTAPPTSGNTAIVFAGSPPRTTPDVNGTGYNVTSLAFNSGATSMTLFDQTLTISSSAGIMNNSATSQHFFESIVLASDQIWSGISAASSIVVDGGPTSPLALGSQKLTLIGPESIFFGLAGTPIPITGNNAGNIAMNGTGVLYMNGSNTFGGGVTLGGTGGATVEIGSGSALGTGQLTVNAGAATAFEGDGNGAYSLSNTINIFSTLNVTGNSNLTLTGFMTGGSALNLVNSPATLTLSGTGNYAGNVNVQSGTVVQNMPLGGNVANQSDFIFNGGGGITGRLTNNASATFNANFVAANGMANNGVTTIASGTNLTLGGSGLNNQGAMGMVGGILALSSTTANTNGGNINLSPSTILALSAGSGATLNNTGLLALNGAVVTGAAGQLNNTLTGTISGGGIIQSVLTNNGLMAIGTAQMDIVQPFTNAGTIQLTASDLTGGAIANNGTINGLGNLASAVVNSSTGTIEASGNGNLYITGALTNNGGGLLTADAGSKMLVSQGLATNAGTINLTGGIFDNNGFALNNTGQISGFGIFRTGGAGLTNNGSITFSGGTTTVNGNVTNPVGQLLTVAYNPAIFTGAVVNNGTFKATNTTVTFAGSFTGGFTSDPSTDVFQSNVLVPGGDAMTGGVGDQFFMTNGTFANSGTFNNGGLLHSSDPINNTGTFTQTGSLVQSANFTNSGTATLGGSQAWSHGTTFTNTAGLATIQSDAGSPTSSTLSFNVTGGKVALASPQHWAGLTVTGSGIVDIANNHIVLSYGATDPASSVYSYLQSGYAGGSWTGPGINSSIAALPANKANYGVGFVDGADNIPGNSAPGVPLTSGQILIAYALYGDVNLDGLVNATDLAIFGASFNTATVGWEHGDFIYTGLVNATDLALLGSNFGKAASGAALDLPAADYAALDAFAAANGVSLTSVPEPGTLAIAVTAGMIMRRRRR